MKIVAVLSPFIFLFYTFSAYAEFTTARTLGFAGVGSVNGESTGLAISHNPAALSINADLEFGAGYGRGELPIDIDQKGYYLWAKDSIASSFRTSRNKRVKNAVGENSAFPFAAAVIFSDYETDLVEYKAYKLSFAKVVSPKMTLGGSAKYLDGLKLNQPLDKWSGDFGAVYKFSQKLLFGLSWINLNSNEDSGEERLRFGSTYIVSELARLFLDVDYSLEDVEDELAFGLGFEAKIREFFAFRSGYFLGKNGAEDRLGLGLSFMGPRLQMHYGVRVEMDSRAALHSVDFSLPLW